MKTRCAAAAGLLLLGLGLSSGASGETVFAIESASCSGTASRSESATRAFFGCTGNYQLVHGSIVSDKTVTIRATSLLDLQGVTIQAPVIELWVLDGTLNMDSSTTLVGTLDVIHGPKPLEVVAPTGCTAGQPGGGAVVISAPAEVPLPEPACAFGPVTGGSLPGTSVVIQPITVQPAQPAAEAPAIAIAGDAAPALAPVEPAANDTAPAPAAPAASAVPAAAGGGEQAATVAPSSLSATVAQPGGGAASGPALLALFAAAAALAVRREHR